MSIKFVSGNWVIDKAPEAKLIYGFDLAKENWMPEGAVITDLTVTVEGVTLVDSNFGNGQVLAQIEGGTVDEAAWAKFVFTLDNGDIDSRILYFKIKAR